MKRLNDGLDDEKDNETKTENNVKENDIHVILNMDTKLGNSKKDFVVADLQRIKYFKNQLSGRWNNDKRINISSTDLDFSVRELEALIFYKKYNKINKKYPHQRLPYFCNALDYFTEQMEQKIFVQYVSECVPAIQYQQLISLQSLCGTKECHVLSEVIKLSIKQINDSKKTYHSKIFNNFKTVSSQCLVCNDYVAAYLFIKYFKVDYCTFLFIKHRNVTDLNNLWNHIIKNKLYLNYPEILKTIYDFKSCYNQYSYTKISEDVTKSLTNIAVNTMELILTDKNICTEDNKQGIKNMLENFVKLINEQTFKGNQDILYQFVKKISLKALELEKNNVDTFNTIFVIFKSTTSWFVSCAKKEKVWITKEIPKYYSVQAMEPLFHCICDYVTSKAYEKNPCLPVYIDLVNKYTNIDWIFIQ